MLPADGLGSLALGKRLLIVTAVVFALALAARLAAVAGPWDAVRHGSAFSYGSAALGLYNGDGLTYHLDEIPAVVGSKSNLTGDYREFYSGSAGRQSFTLFLPGPALTLAALWKLTGWHTFGPYLVMQALLSSLLVALFFLATYRREGWLTVAVTAFLICNPVDIRVVVSMGYDFWPGFCVLASFIVLAEGLRRGGNPKLLLLAGVVAGLVYWFRAITTLLPGFLAAALVYYLRFKTRLSWPKVVARTVLYLLPALLSVLLLTGYRHAATGNARPSRNVFWHTFFAGVGQFSNPYGLKNEDRSVFEFGHRLDSEIDPEQMAEQYGSPDSRYETVLKEAAFDFVQEHPFLFLRNATYRTMILISPTLYSDAEFLPTRLRRPLFYFGLILVPLWLLGGWRLFRMRTDLFVLAAAIYGCFVVSFSWFYVIGRVIQPLLFLNVILYGHGLVWLWQRVGFRPGASGDLPNANEGPRT